MGFLPRQEVAREVSFARERGLSRFAALAPNTPYGRLMTDALRDTVGRPAAPSTKVEYLNADGGRHGRSAVERLVGAGGPDGKGRVRRAAAAGRRRPAEADRAPGQGGRRRSRQGAAARQRVVGRSARSPASRRCTAAGSPPRRPSAARIRSRFQATYGHPPPRLASLAFDAAALAAVLAKRGREPFSREAILNPSGFTGVDGLFRFTRSGAGAARPRGARSDAAGEHGRQPRAAELPRPRILAVVREARSELKDCRSWQRRRRCGR